MKTVIDWNHLEDDIADTTLSEAFWEYLSSDQLFLLTHGFCALSRPLRYYTTVLVLRCISTGTDRIQQIAVEAEMS